MVGLIVSLCMHVRGDRTAMAGAKLGDAIPAVHVNVSCSIHVMEKSPGATAGGGNWL
jgi:hypothetical protein